MDIKYIMSQLTLEEKAYLITGKDAWSTYPIKRLGIPSMMVSDGPHGLRKPISTDGDIAIHESIEAICYPPAVGIASSWDKKLAQRMGENLSLESQYHNLGVLLGPGANIKRSPLCGRNFEYFSEDPVLSGMMAGYLIKGIQSTGVSASLKHFLANNQETDRMAVSAEVDQRALREIYAKSFEKAFEVEQPWSVMCAYNRVNGEYVSESEAILTDLLRNELGFKGFVVSDWGAVNKAEVSINAGVDLEMPGNSLSPKRVLDAVASEKLTMAVLDRAVERILSVVLKTQALKIKATIDLEFMHKEAVEIAKGCIVLLKNEAGILPLKNNKILVLGEFAISPRIQGEGSSMVKPYKIDEPLESLNAYFKELEYRKGYSIKEDDIELAETLSGIDEFDQVIIYAGLPDEYEAEGVDRTHLSLPKNQQTLIDAVTKEHDNVVIVLMNGAVIEMTQGIERAKGILETWLLGEGAAEAIASVLSGKSNPCGRLAETIPHRLEDSPSYLNFPGFNNVAKYNEGIFVGYRYYDKRKMDVAYPFGHGLSYSNFEYSDLTLDNRLESDDELIVQYSIKNTSDVDGHEVSQVYLSAPSNTINREKLSLKAFDKCFIEAGESVTVEHVIRGKDFKYYSQDIREWVFENGKHKIVIGASSRDLRLEASFNVVTKQKKKLTLFDPLKAIMDEDVYKEKYNVLIHQMVMGDLNIPLDLENQVTRNLYHFYIDMPLIKVINFSKGTLTEESVQELLDQINDKNG